MKVLKEDRNKQEYTIPYVVTVVINNTDGDGETGMMEPDWYQEIVYANSRDDAKRKIQSQLGHEDRITGVRVAAQKEVNDYYINSGAMNNAQDIRLTKESLNESGNVPYNVEEMIQWMIENGNTKPQIVSAMKDTFNIDKYTAINYYYRVQDKNKSKNESMTNHKVVDAHTFANLSKQQILTKLDDLEPHTRLSGIINAPGTFAYNHYGDHDCTVEKWVGYSSNYHNPVNSPNDWKSMEDWWEVSGSKRDKWDVANIILGNNKYYCLRPSNLTEDTIKLKNGKWTNLGKDGSHGNFKTKKEADSQRKAMFANGYTESLTESLNMTTIGDMLEGSIGNMSDRQLDKDIATYNRIAKTFGMSIPDDIVVLVDDYGEYDPKNYNNSSLIREVKNVQVYSFSGKDLGEDFTFCREMTNGNMYLYFENEQNAESYVNSIDIINNGFEEDDSFYI